MAMNAICFFKTLLQLPTSSQHPNITKNVFSVSTCSPNLHFLFLNLLRTPLLFSFWFVAMQLEGCCWDVIGYVFKLWWPTHGKSWSWVMKKGLNWEHCEGHGYQKFAIHCLCPKRLQWAGPWKAWRDKTNSTGNSWIERPSKQQLNHAGTL